MGRCDICDDFSSFDYSCKYCGGNFCNKHRMPERHDCVYLTSAQTLGPEFRNIENVDISSKTSDEETSEAVDRREERETTQCVGCGELISADRKYCPICRMEGVKMDVDSGPEVRLKNPEERDAESDEQHEKLDPAFRMGLTTRILSKSWVTLFLIMSALGLSIGYFLYPDLTTSFLSDLLTRMLGVL